MLPKALGMPATMPAKMISEIPLPMPALGDLLAEPHDEGGARGEGQNGHEPKQNPGLSTIPSPPGPVIRSSDMAMPNPWMMLRTTVP